MPEIADINGVAIANVAKVDGLATSSILDINGVTVDPGINPTAPTSGFLFTYDNAAVAYSVRQLNNNADQIMRVRRASDNVEADVGFDAGELKLTSPISKTSDAQSYTDFADFVDHTGTPTDAFVRYWYDQSSNQNHAGQSTAPSQPQIYDATTGLIEAGSVGNEKPALNFDGSNDYFTLTATTSTNSVCQILVSVYDTSASSLKMALGGGTGPFWQHYSSNTMRIRTTSGDVTFVTGLTNGDQFLCFMNGNSGAYTAHLNGASKFTGNRGNWYINQIGRGLNTSTYAFDNVIQEVILYETEKSSSRTGIETSINGFFNIY